MKKDNIKYDIALSYAKEDRVYVDAVAEKLSEIGVRCFYDFYEQANLWGKDLYQHLFSVYSEQARYTIIFISKHYAQKVWTNHELKSAQSRAIKQNAEYILPVRFDNTELPGLSQNTAYIDLNNISPLELAETVVKKLNLKRTNLTHIGYSYLIVKRHMEESSRNESLWSRFWNSDKWDYSIPISIYFNSVYVGKSTNGGELLIETTPGKHIIKAKESAKLAYAAGDAGIDFYEVTVETGMHEINLIEGKNIIYLNYNSGHVRHNISDGYSTIYFSEVE